MALRFSTLNNPMIIVLMKLNVQIVQFTYMFKEIAALLRIENAEVILLLLKYTDGAVCGRIFNFCTKNYP